MYDDTDETDWVDFTEEGEAVRADLEQAKASHPTKAGEVDRLLDDVDELCSRVEITQTVTPRMRKRMRVIGQRAQRWLGE